MKLTFIGANHEVTATAWRHVEKRSWSIMEWSRGEMFMKMQNFRLRSRMWIIS